MFCSFYFNCFSAAAHIMWTWLLNIFFCSKAVSPFTMYIFLVLLSCYEWIMYYLFHSYVLYINTDDLHSPLWLYDSVDMSGNWIHYSVLKKKAAKFLCKFLGSITKLLKVTISYGMSVCLFICPHGTTLLQLDRKVFFENLLRRFKFD